MANAMLEQLTALLFSCVPENFSCNNVYWAAIVVCATTATFFPTAFSIQDVVVSLAMTLPAMETVSRINAIVRKRTRRKADEGRRDMLLNAIFPVNLDGENGLSRVPKVNPKYSEEESAFNGDNREAVKIGRVPNTSARTKNATKTSGASQTLADA